MSSDNDSELQTDMKGRNNILARIPKIYTYLI